MARSIHENPAKKGFHHVDWDTISAKRRIKRIVKKEQSSDAHLPVGVPSLASTLPINFRLRDDYAFCPVTAKDIRAVLAMLPRDVCAGIKEIVIAEYHDRLARYVPLSNLVLPREIGPIRKWYADGVFIPRVGGTYNMNTGRITLHSYFRVPHRRPTKIERACLQCVILSTLVHEVAHAFDRAHRIGKGRWRMDDTAKDEKYANRMMEEWIDMAVVPHVMQKIR